MIKKDTFFITTGNQAVCYGFSTRLSGNDTIDCAVLYNLTRPKIATEGDTHNFAENESVIILKQAPNVTDQAVGQVRHTNLTGTTLNGNKYLVLVYLQKQNKSRLKKVTIILILYVLIGFSCRKDNKTEKCGCGGPKTAFIEKIFGIVVETDDGFEILTDEKGLLIPCSGLARNFKTGSQPVTISGTLKIPCKEIPDEFSITPIEISELTLRNANYDKKDITLTIIKSEDYGYNPGFGYFIEDHRSLDGIKILQPHLPVVSGLIPFNTADRATETGLLVIYLMRKNQGQLPSLTMEILQYTNIIN